MMAKRLALLHSLMFGLLVNFASSQQPRFKALVLYENGGHHIAYSLAAKEWLTKLGRDSSFAITYINNTDSIDTRYLQQFKLFIQLDYPPYGWKEKAATAFEDYITKGKGGWIGFHHASLLGEFDGFKIWPWFYGFMGSVQFKNYIPGFADGNVHTEEPLHPVMQNMPTTFKIEKEEWYTYDKSPRPNVKVIASVDESSYSPASDVKMGDHPVIWTNTKLAAKNIYIFMGHSPLLFKDVHYTTLFRNAIFWAASAN